MRPQRFPRRPPVGRAAACLGAILLACGLASAGDWPQFRGPTTLGYSDEKDLPLTWGGKSSENILWKVPLPKSHNPFSSPIVSGDRVFVTLSQYEPVDHRVLCFQKADGRLLWDTNVPPGPLVLKDPRGGYCAPTPAADGKRVYVVFASAVVACLDFDGKIVWRTALKEYAFDVTIGDSPIIYKDTLIFLCDFINKSSNLTAFDLKTGDIRWKQPRPEVNFSHTTPAIVEINGAPQMLICASNAVQGLDPASGKLIWWCAARGDVCGPAYGAGVVYAEDGRGNSGLAVDPTGKGDVTKTHLKWAADHARGELSSPVIVGEYLYRLGSQKLLCMKAATGELVYSEKLPGINSYVTPIPTADGRLYVASSGKSYVVKLGAKFEILGTSDLGDSNHAMPAISDGRMFLKGQRFLYCIGKK